MKKTENEIKLRLVISVCFLLILQSVSFSQDAVCTAAPPICIDMQNGRKCDFRTAEISGSPFIVPKLKVQIVNKRNLPITGAKLIFDYNWKWLEYPYPERLRGVWSNASGSFSCRIDTNGIVRVPELKLTPVGWYDGIFSIGNKPKITNVWIRYEYEPSPGKMCYGRPEFGRTELETCKRGGKCEFVISDECS